MKNKVEKVGSFGALLAAAACPVCFPKLALLGAILGLGALAPYETALFYSAQTLVILAAVGHAVSYRTHRRWLLLCVALLSSALFFIALYVYASELLAYVAFAGLMIATFWLALENRRCSRCATLPDQQT